MARDLDFRAHRRVAKHAPAVNRQKRPRQAAGLIVLLTITGLLLIGFGLLKEASNLDPDSREETKQPEKTTVPSVIPLEASVNPNTNQTNPLTENTAQLLTIRLYDSGAGEEAVAQLSKTLTDQGHKVEQAGKSQFEYDKTYLWYAPGNEAKAQTIAALLSDRQIGLKESKIAFASAEYSILIYLGKN